MNTIDHNTKACLNGVQGLVLIVSRTGTIRFANEAALRLLQVQYKDLSGHPWFDRLLLPCQRHQAKAFWKEQTNTATEQSITTYVQTANGGFLLVRWTATPVDGTQQKHTTWILSGDDISETHRLRHSLAEEEQRHHQERLKVVLEATERERQLLAYELHDDVNQVLTTCKLLLEAERATHPGAGTVQKVAGYIQEVINTLRELSHNLNPARLGREGLLAAANKLVSRINDTGRIQVQLRATGLKHLRHLPDTTCLSLYRIMQEALNNILKHAGAHNAQIHLKATRETVRLEILDNGRGFRRNPDAIGLGLQTIHTRAEAAGGTATIRSAPGEGTRLTIDIPLHHGPGPDAPTCEKEKGPTHQGRIDGKPENRNGILER